MTSKKRLQGRLPINRMLKPNEDGNYNGKCTKSNRLNGQNNNFARAICFLYISLLSLHDYDVKLPNFTFCGGRDEKIFFLFLNVDIGS